jgi:hypothetical protein
MRWKIEALRSAAAVQAHENEWFFLGRHESRHVDPVPTADGHCCVCLRYFDQGRAENVQESASETVLGRHRGNGRIRVQTRHQ